MAKVYRPVKPPPKLHYTTLSSEAQKTLEDLQRKYSTLLTYVQTPDVSYPDPANYYKSIYNTSFRKCFSTAYPERSQDGNNKIPECKDFIDRPMTFSQEHSNILDTNSSIEYAHHTLKSSKFEKKGSNIRPETEVFLKYRPSDEEIAESILQLTQRTSNPDSPCLDLNSDLEENQQFDDYASGHSVSRGPNIRNYVGTVCLSPPTTKSSLSESYYQPVSHFKGNYKELHYHVSGQESPTATRVKVQKESEVSDYISVTNKVNLNHSPVIFSSVDEANVLSTNKKDTNEDKHKCVADANNTHNYKQIKDTFTAMEVADFELNLSDFECSQKSYNSQHNYKDSFENRTDTCIKENYCFKDSCEQSESPFMKDRMVTNKCDAADLPLQTFIENRSSENDESPYVEAAEISRTSHLKPVTETSTAVQGTSKITGCYVKQKNGNLFRSAHYKKESSCKDHIQIDKRRNEQYSNSGTKKFKPYFKPPFKEKAVLSGQSEFLLSEVKNSRKQLDSSLFPVQGVISLSSLSSEKQTETLSMWECSQSVVLTLLYNSSQTLMTTFYSAADHAKRKNSTVQPTIVGVVILDEGSTTSSFFIPNELICRDDIKATLLSILVSENITKIIANCKEFLIGVHKLCSLNSGHGIPCECIEDPVIACWLVDPDNQPASFMHMCRTADIEHRSDDANWLAYLQMTPKLMHNFRNILKSNKLWSVFTQIEMKLIPILACMETQTIKVDTALFVKFSDILKSKIKKLEEAVYKEAGRKFSLNSHVQLRQILYEELELDKKLAPNIKIIKTDVSNQKSTCESSLKLLAAVHPLPAHILEYRQMQKLMSTYVDGMMSCVTNGSIMTHWDQTAAATGRLTSSQPNIQAVPKTVITVTDFQLTYVIGSEKVLNVDIHAREPFISRPGCVFLAADFQQAELRVLAHLSGDSTLQSLFKNITGEDIFISLTKQCDLERTVMEGRVPGRRGRGQPAGRWTQGIEDTWGMNMYEMREPSQDQISLQQNKTSKDVTTADREQTKRVVYSVMYGVGKDKLAEYLKVKPDIAQDIITSFLLQFPAIGSFTKKCWTYAQEYGYTETVSGRRRYFPHINSSSPVLRAQAQRQAVNFCVQGSAADICKLAMLAVERQLQDKSHLSCRLLLQIHDELIWEVPEDQLPETKSVIQKVIEDPETLCGTVFTLQVPLTVAFSSGKSWAHMNPFI